MSSTQHQLAILRPRDDDELSRADGRAHRSQLRVGATGIALAVALIRGFARRSARASATSGSISRAARPTSCRLRSSACSSSGRACRRTSAPTPGNHARGRPAGDRPRPGLQEVIKMLGQRRRLLQRQLRPSFENPNAITNFVQIVLIFSIGASSTSSAAWSAISARAGRVRRDGHPVPGRCHHGLPGRVGGHPAFAPLGIDTAASSLQAGGNMEQGSPLRIANSALFVTVTMMPRAALSIPCTTASRRSEAWSRRSTSSWARSSSAASAPVSACCCLRHRRVRRRADGRPHAQYLGKKIEAKEVKMAMLAILILPLSILGSRRSPRSLAPALPVPPTRTARLQRNPLRHLGHRQRLGVRRHQRQYDVLQHDHRLRDVHRPLPDDRADGRHRQLACRQEGRPPGRHLPTRPAVRRPGCRRHPDRGRSPTLPALAPARWSNRSR